MFKQALEDFVNRPGVFKMQGAYRGNPVTIYTDPGYSTAVLVSPHGEFVSGWRLNADQSKNLKDRNSL